ncbi:MAG: Trp family transcriptional regulator [Candidatus Pacearchaeota archaeon]
MPRVSKFLLRDKQIKEISSHLHYLISLLNNENEISNFLGNFLTKEEKLMLSKRLVLLMMLKRQYSPSAIKNILHVSYETIRIYQNQLNSKNEIFEKILKKILQRQKTKELFDKINKFLKPIDLAMRSKTNMRARAKFASGNWFE